MIPLEHYLSVDILALVIHGLGFGTQLVGGFSGALRDALSYGMPDNLSTTGLISGMFTASFALGCFVGPSCAGPLLDNFGFRNATLFVIVLQAMLGVSHLFYICCCSASKASIESQQPILNSNTNYGTECTLVDSNNFNLINSTYKTDYENLGTQQDKHNNSS